MENSRMKNPNALLREALEQKQQEYGGKIDVLSMSMLSWPSGVSSARQIMANTHPTHARNITYPENPKVETGWENLAGSMSTAYKKADTDLTVHAIIPKFNAEGMDTHLYYMFLYDEENDTYKVIEKKNVENLTEKFGYCYNTSNMDSKKKGDKFKKGETIYASNSYDEYGNYRRGINAKAVFMIHNDTIEDAVVISESLRDRASSIETDVVRVTINDNDFLKNLYSKNKGEYKGFPDIGDRIKDGVLCAKGRIHNDQILYTMNSSNLKSISYSSDVPYYCDGIIEDIIIYSNKSLDEVPNDSFNAQIKFYLELQTEFYTKILHVCNEILESGSKYSSDIPFLYQKAKDILDDEVKWKDENNRKFNNFIIEFLVKNPIKLVEGHKIAGGLYHAPLHSDVYRKLL